MKDSKRNENIHQEIERSFKCYKKNITYRSKDYQNLIIIRAILSIKGYRSHPIFFDVMTKEGMSYFISLQTGNASLIYL